MAANNESKRLQVLAETVYLGINVSLTPEELLTEMGER